LAIDKKLQSSSEVQGCTSKVGSQFMQTLVSWVSHSLMVVDCYYLVMQFPAKTTKETDLCKFWTRTTVVNETEPTTISHQHLDYFKNRTKFL